jgi:hypothetical protein
MNTQEAGGWRNVAICFMIRGFDKKQKTKKKPYGL